MTGKATDPADSAGPSREELAAEAVGLVWGDTTNKVNDPEPKAQDEGDEPEPKVDEAKADSAEDIWAEASDAQRAAFEQTQAELAKIQKTWERQRNQVSGMSRKVEELQRALAEKQEAAAEESAAPSFDEVEAELKTLREEFPDIAKPVDKLSAVVRTLASRFDNVDTANQNAAQRAADSAEDEDQPAWVQRAVQLNADAITDAKLASKLIARFKEHVGLTDPPQADEDKLREQERRKRQLSGAASPAPKGRGATSSDPVTTDRATNVAWAAAKVWGKNPGF
jgi:chromosome segregation ATPase